MKRTDLDFLQDIRQNVERAESFVQGVDLSALSGNYEKVYAIAHALQIIDEAARHLPKSLLHRYPEIIWDDIIGMRDIVIHEYFGVDLEIVWRTVHEDLPPLKTVVTKILTDLANEEK